MKVIIIDDEIRSISNLKNIITKYCPTIVDIKEATNIIEAENLLRKEYFDIIFLDIEMPNGNGFELLTNIQDLSTNVIFVTAFEHYAVEAFRKNAIDYLLKPIDIDQLIEAIGKVKQKNVSSINQILKKFPTQFNTNKIKLPTLNGFELVLIDEIIYIKSSGNYSHIFLKNDKKHIISKNIGEIEKNLDPTIFIRIHNEHIVNINEIVRYIKGRGGYVILKNNQHLDVSFRRKKFLLDVLT
jgi:two-component system LytT family response regulator